MIDHIITHYYISLKHPFFISGNALYVEANADESAQGVEELSIKQNEVFIVDRHKYAN